MWERGAAATVVAKPVVETRPPGMAKSSAPTKPVCAVFPGEAGSSGSRASGTEGSRVGVCGDGAEGSRVGVCGDGAEGSRVGVCGDGAEGSRVGVCGDGTEGSRVGVFGDGTEGSRVGVCGDGTEGSRVGVCGDGTEGSRVGVCGDGAEGSRVGVCGDGTEGSRVGVCGDGIEGSRVGVCGDGTKGSRVGVCGDGIEGSRGEFLVEVGGARLGKQSQVIEVPKTSCQESVEVEQTMQRAVELLSDMEHELAFRKLEKFREKLRKLIEQVEKERSRSFLFFCVVKSDQHCWWMIFIWCHEPPT